MIIASFFVFAAFFPADAFVSLFDIDLTCIDGYTDECMDPDPEVQAAYGGGPPCSNTGPSICLVPMGGISLDTIESVAAGLEEKTGIKVQIARPMALPDTSYDFRREQFYTRPLLDALESTNASALNGGSGKRLVVALTPGEIFSSAVLPITYRMFGDGVTRNDGRTISVVSTYAMRSFVFDHDAVNLRAQKLLTQYAALYVLGMQASNDPHSVLYEDVRTFIDLDRMGEDLPKR